MTNENTPVLLQTGKKINTGQYSSTLEVHLGFTDGTSECGKIFKVLGQEIIFSEKNLDLITCQQCLESALNILGIHKTGWFHPSFFI